MLESGEASQQSLYYQRQLVGRKVQSQELHSKLLFDPSSLISNTSRGAESQWVNQTLKTGQRLFLYSAYHVGEVVIMCLQTKIFTQDGRGSNAMVRILGAAPHRFKTMLSCVCVDKSGYKIHARVDVRQNKEHWALPYSSYFFNCLMRGTFHPVQVQVGNITY